MAMLARVREASAGGGFSGPVLSRAWSMVFDCEQRCLSQAELTQSPPLRVTEGAQQVPWEALKGAIAERDLDTLIAYSPRLLEERVRYTILARPERFWESLDALVVSAKFREVFVPKRSHGHWFFGVQRP